MTRYAIVGVLGIVAVVVTTFTGCTFIEPDDIEMHRPATALVLALEARNWNEAKSVLAESGPESIRGRLLPAQPQSLQGFVGLFREADVKVRSDDELVFTVLDGDTERRVRLVMLRRDGRWVIGNMILES